MEKEKKEIKKNEIKMDFSTLLIIVLSFLFILAICYIGYTELIGNNNNNNSSNNKCITTNDGDTVNYNEDDLNAWLNDNARFFEMINIDTTNAKPTDYGKFLAMYILNSKSDTRVTIKEGHDLYGKYNYVYSMSKEESLTILKKYFGNNDMEFDYDNADNAEGMSSAFSFYSDDNNYYIATIATEMFENHNKLLNIAFNENSQLEVTYAVVGPHPDEYKYYPYVGYKVMTLKINGDSFNISKMTYTEFIPE